MPRLSGDGQRVLLVEDDPAISELLQTVLMGMGLHVDVAPNGSRALELAEKHRPSLVVLDLGLPEMYGKTVAATLRRQRRARAQADAEEPPAQLAVSYHAGHGTDRPRAGFLAHATAQYAARDVAPPW